jgi:hypothetical protein
MKTTIFAIFISISALAFADEPIDTQPDYHAMTGTGQFSCGQFSQYVTQRNEVEIQLVTQWVWGFLSAYNLRANFASHYKRQPNHNLATLPDEATVPLYLQNYCGQHPLDSVLDGSMALIQQLGGQVIWKQKLPAR